MSALKTTAVLSIGRWPMRALQSKAFFATSFALVLALALTLAAVAKATPSYEPNDSFATAYGPLVAGGTYSDTIATADDEDDYYFYVTDPNGADIQLTIADPTVSDNGVYTELDDSSQNYIDSTDVFSEGSETLDEQLGPGKYFVSVQAEFDQQDNEAYDLTIDAPAGALGTTTQVKAQCKSATASVTAAKAALARAQKRLKRAHKGSAHRKAQARRAVKKARNRLRTATAAMNAACGLLG